MIERIVLGLCLVFLIAIKLSMLVNVGVFLVLFILILTLKPYLNVKHNITFCLNMIICIIIQGIYLSYKVGTTVDNSK